MLTKDTEEGRKPASSGLRSCEKRKGDSGLEGRHVFCFPSLSGKGGCVHIVREAGLCAASHPRPWETTLRYTNGKWSGHLVRRSEGLTSAPK